jgi:hypothetical protein
MKPVFLKFVKNLLGFTVILIAFAFGLAFILPPAFISPALPWLFLFFLAVTISGYYLLIKATNKRFLKFLNYFLLITLVKLILFVGVLVIYIMMHKWDAVPFGLSFFILYLFYTAYEVVALVKFSKTLQH